MLPARLALVATAAALLPQASTTIAARIPPPAAYERVAVPAGRFGAWLRELKLRPGKPPVRLHDGRPKTNQTAHYAVIDIDVGPRDLQQ